MSRKLLGIIITIILTMAGGALYLAIGDLIFPPAKPIEIMDINPEWLSSTELRVSIDVLNKNNDDWEIEVQFTVDQVGEATKVKTLMFIIES